MEAKIHLMTLQLYVCNEIFPWDHPWYKMPEVIYTTSGLFQSLLHLDMR